MYLLILQYVPILWYFIFIVRTINNDKEKEDNSENRCVRLKVFYKKVPSNPRKALREFPSVKCQQKYHIFKKNNMLFCG